MNEFELAEKAFCEGYATAMQRSRAWKCPLMPPEVAFGLSQTRADLVYELRIRQLVADEVRAALQGNK